MKKLLLSILFLIPTLVVLGQESSLTGKIIDSKTLKPLTNVVLTIENTNQTKLTTSNGVFKFDKMPVGSHSLIVTYTGYTTQVFQLELTEGELLDLGTVVLEEDITTEKQLSLVTITENDLGDDNSGSESTSGLLQATRDVFQQAAAFNWGQARFRVRGLDNEYGVTMINGLTMNKLYDGRPQWSNWGGLNDATRNQEFSMGTTPSDYTFGNILGTQEINTRASFYRPLNRVTFSGTNTNYSWRAMATHASGFNKDGWAYTLSASKRWAQEGFYEGTDYSANSFFASLEKKINEKHSLNLTLIFAQNSRGKSSPNSQEVTDLMGVRYNSYWGYQDGKKRNSRDKDIQEPMVILSHYWKLNENNRLNTNISYQTGSIGNSRVDFTNGNNPDPTYYGYLPSYFLNDLTKYVTVNGVTTNPLADKAKNKFLNNSQINWNAMYIANQNSSFPGRSIYALYEDRTDDNQINANAILTSRLSDNISLNAGVSFKKLKSHNFQNLIDLMGGSYYLDIDQFYEGNASQSDLNNPNRNVGEGDTYGYNYNLNATVADAFSQFKFTYNKLDFYVAQSFSKTEYQREGLYRNGIYANNSYGDSEKVNFENFGFKGGLTYKITGRHLLSFNGGYLTKAPNLRNTFSNARLNNNYTPDLESENIMSMDASYIIRAPKLKARLTGFMTKIQNTREISFYYAENISDVSGNGNAFISEIVRGINKKNIGIELGAEYQITSTIKAKGAASYGQYIYENNPDLYISDDSQASALNTNPITSFGKTYLKDYNQAGMPQQAYSLGLEYRSPKFWWIGANANYLADSFIDVSNVLRTNNFTIDNNGLTFPGADEATVKSLLKQEKFNSFTLINLVGGKSWKISKKYRNIVGFFASINNVFDVVYKTGGFEQSRKATFTNLQQDLTSGSRAFGPKYFYGYGRTYFLNFYINF